MTRPENAIAVRVGVASHNLFDIAFAMLLRQKRDVVDRVEFEMLEGMANAQALEVRDRTGGMIVYTPACYENEFEAAVAYLVRRLDENTEPGSFLGDLFALRESSPQWDDQKKRFMEAFELAFDSNLAATPNRKQNRLSETNEEQSAFCNVADTDFSLPANREWAEKILAEWKDKKLDPIPIQVAGEMSTEKLTGNGHDPSRPGRDAYQFAQGTADDVERALVAAEAAQGDWDRLGIEERGKILRRAATIFADQRGDTIGSMLLDGGKTIIEADVEVSEAIDFANYYSRSLDQQGWQDGLACSGRGIVVVTPPWNFPYAIPAGGVLSALMAGNSVILKPARESVLIAWQLAEQLWQAGVPKAILQFLPLVDGATGKVLVTDPRVDSVILTGSIFTAQLFQGWRPELKLYAETSGKNCMIITAAADPDLAIKDLVKGAFGHAGQKCSATSIALVQRELYDDPKFQNQLKDAVESLHIGSSWDGHTFMTPVIRKPDEYLEKGLTQLGEGERWLCEPKMLDNNPCLWTPGVRMDVKPGSWYHQTECFGPVTGLIPFDTLEEAIEIQNSSDFGLTGGLHSLDPKEIELWREKVEVGNAYINRTTTGAIVQRQPFGGWKDSCVGPGPKAGGPNYVSAFCDWQETGLPSDREQVDDSLSQTISAASQACPEISCDRVKAAAGSYAYWWKHEFSVEHDPSQVHGETNHFRYRPRPFHMVRIENSKQPAVFESLALAALACKITRCALFISVGSSELANKLSGFPAVDIKQETAEQAAQRLKTMKGGTIRFLDDHDANVFAPVEIGNIPVVRQQVYANGRLELLNYLKRTIRHRNRPPLRQHHLIEQRGRESMTYPMSAPGWHADY